MDTMLDVLSVLDSNDEPVYSNCTLQMGEVALEFKNGRSKVAERYAPEVLRDRKLMVPGYTGLVAPKAPNVAAEIAGDVRQQRQESPAEIEARVAASEEYLRSQGIPVPARSAPVVSSAEMDGLKARIAELEGMLADNVELNPKKTVEARWEGKGLEGVAGGITTEATTTTVKSAVGPSGGDEAPEGIEPLTTDGESRCWARKGDGTQCSNASLEGSHACGLAAHKKLVK